MADPKTTTYDDQFSWDSATTSGLLPEFTAIMRNPEFGIDDEYNDGETLRLFYDLELTVQDNPDFDNEPGDVFHEATNVGAVTTWEALDGGKRAARVDGRPPKANENTGLGKILSAIMGNDYGDDAENTMANTGELLPILQQRGSAFVAATWADLEFVWRRVTFSFTNKEGEKVSYQRLFPVEFVGVAEPGEGGGSNRKSNGSVSSDELDKIRADIAEMATRDEYDTHAKWLSAVMETFPTISSSPDLLQEAMDKDGIYAEARG